MAIDQLSNSQSLLSEAEQALQQVGEALLARIRQELPRCELVDEPLQVLADLDDGTHPASVELRFETTAEMYRAYEQLSGDERFEVFKAVRSAARNALHRAEPAFLTTEQDRQVYVFGDQSAIELTLRQHRRDDALFLPSLRAISWKLPLLLVGDDQRPTEMNLFRLGYQETSRSTDTTIYRHYDPIMPLVGYGFAEGCYHLTIFSTGQRPAILSIPQIGEGRGQLVHLREQTCIDAFVLNQKPTVFTHVDPEKTRYPASLLDQVASQFAIQLTGDNAKRLLNGQKTDVVITGVGNIGKLYVLNTPETGPQLVLQDVRRELTLKDSYLGHVFTDKDKQNLTKYGDMGRAVDLIDKQSGQKFTGFVGVDKDTKTLTVLRADQIRPKIERMSHLKGIPLNGLQKQRLMEGKAIRLDNMTSKAGTSFSAYVRVSAAGRNLRFDHIPTGQSQKAVSDQADIKDATSVVGAGKPAKLKRATKTGP